MAIPEDIIQTVQDKSDIVEVISNYVPLKKTGRNYKAPCPFHHEKTPSFVVSPDKQIYHCFGCGAGGNVFTFLMKFENMEFPEAVEMLAQKAGVSIPRQDAFSNERAALANQLYKINEEAAQFFQAALMNNKPARDYISQRGIGDDCLKLFKIGYAPDGWEGLVTFFKKKGIGADMLEKAGLVIPNDRGGYYDRFRRRIIFPITDLKNKMLGFGARVLDNSLPKYVNSPETSIYSKGRHFYGLSLSRDFIRQAGYVLVVEGYLDFIIPYQAGVKNLIATLGTALTQDQVKLLKRFADTVIMVYDPDEAGESASLRNMDIFMSEDMNVYIAELPQGLDPDSAIKKLGAEEFMRLVKGSKNIFDYKLERLLLRYDGSTARGKASIAGEMLQTLSKITNEVFKSSLLKKLAERLSVDEESLKAELKKTRSSGPVRQRVADVISVKDGCSIAEKMALSIMLEDKKFIEKVKHGLSPDDFQDTLIKVVINAVFNLYDEGVDVNASKLMNHLNNNSEAARLISEAINVSENIVDKSRALDDCIARIRMDCTKNRLGRLRQEIKFAHDSNDEERLMSLISQYDMLVKSKKT